MDRHPPTAGSTRRGFLAAALGIAAAGVVGCDSSSSDRTRRLPAGARPEAGGGEPPPDQPLPVRRMVERPLPPTSEPAVRVRVATVRSPMTRLRIEGEGPRIRVGVVDGPTKQVTLPAEIQTTVDGWVAIESVGTKRAGTFQFPARPLELGALPGERGIRLASSHAGSAVLPGSIRLVARTDEGPGALDVVCHLPMETYLPGVLAKELYNSWSLETHLAQAVAARSYALCEMAQAVGRHFDVVAGEASQAWIGATSHKTSLEAVRRTTGMLLTYEGRVVPAYYSSTCGGRPANAVESISDAIVNDIAPLRATAGMERDCCKAAPAWRWSMTLPTAETAKRLALWARTERPAMAKIDGLRSIEAGRTNACGRPVSFRIRDAKGQVFEIPAEQLRWAFNADVPGLAPNKTRVKSADFVPSVTPVSVNLAGRGFGHGVGMCQYGAEAMSRGGSTWRDILRTYYPSAEIQASYSSQA